LRENSELTLQLCHLVQGKLQLSKWGLNRLM
jgi:hypothetical protein